MSVKQLMENSPLFFRQTLQFTLMVPILDLKYNFLLIDSTLMEPIFGKKYNFLLIDSTLMEPILG